MALPTPEQMADPEFIKQFVAAAMSDDATARTLDMVGGKLWHAGRIGGRMKYGWFLPEPAPELVVVCVECGEAMADPDELFCDACFAELGEDAE